MKCMGIMGVLGVLLLAGCGAKPTSRISQLAYEHGQAIGDNVTQTLAQFAAKNNIDPASVTLTRAFMGMYDKTGLMSSEAGITDPVEVEKFYEREFVALCTEAKTKNTTPLILVADGWVTDRAATFRRNKKMQDKSRK